MVRIALIACLAVVASNAHADDCEIMKQAMKDAASGFASVRGAQDDVIDGTTYYASNIAMDMLPHCRVMDDSDGAVWSCNNGVGRSRVEVDYAEVKGFVKACGFTVRQSFPRSAGGGDIYEILTDDHQLVTVSTSFSDRRNAATMMVSAKRW